MGWGGGQLFDRCFGLKEDPLSSISTGSTEEISDMTGKVLIGTLSINSNKILSLAVSKLQRCFHFHMCNKVRVLSHFLMEMFLALLPLVNIFLSLFVLLEYVLMLMTSTTETYF